jgi:hypothetical protein
VVAVAAWQGAAAVDQRFVPPRGVAAESLGAAAVVAAYPGAAGEPGAARQSKAVVAELLGAAAVELQAVPRPAQVAVAESRAALAAPARPRWPAMTLRSIRRICFLAEMTCDTSGT